MLVPFDRTFKNSYEIAHLKFIEPILKAAYREKNELDKGKSNNLSPISFLLASELKKTNPNSKLILQCIEKLKSNTYDFGLHDDELLLTPIDTRGDQIYFLESNMNERLEFFNNTSRLKEILPEIWTDFISIVKTITFVSVTGKEELLEHFSGSDSDRWGAMHMSNNLDILNIAECLTHEASHHWMNLYEFYSPVEFIKDGWTNNSFISPWRRDKRPLMGIFHGIYVFSNVYIVLNLLNGFGTGDCERMNYVGAQVKRGIEIMKINQEKLSNNALILLESIITVFQNVYLKTPEEIRQRFYERILNEESMKQEIR